MCQVTGYGAMPDYLTNLLLLYSHVELTSDFLAYYLNVTKEDLTVVDASSKVCYSFLRGLESSCGC